MCVYVCVGKWLNEWIRKEKTERDRRCFKMKNERNGKFNIVVILLILLKKWEREREKERERISLDKEWEKLNKLNIVIILLNEFAIYLKKNL